MTDEIARIVSAQRRRNSEAAVRRSARLEKARQEARRLARRFVEEDPSTKVVVLYGSVATGEVRTESFDIDLAVDADEYLRLIAVAEESAFRVDVVDLRALPEDSRERILRRGIVLHGTPT